MKATLDRLQQPGMVAAIYARKSKEQTGADADAKSVARQIENARAFAASKGWTVDGTSTPTMPSAAPKRGSSSTASDCSTALTGPPLPFHVLIMRDASRFSRRDGDEAFGELKRLAQAGVEIWFYQDGTPFHSARSATTSWGSCAPK